MPEGGGGEGRSGEDAPGEAVLLRRVVWLLHPTPGPHLRGEGCQPVCHFCRERTQFITTDLHVTSLGPLPPPLVVDVISRDPELAPPPPNHPTHQDLQLRLSFYKEIWMFEKVCERAPGVRKLTSTALFASHIFLASIHPTLSLE